MSFIHPRSLRHLAVLTGLAVFASCSSSNSAVPDSSPSAASAAQTVATIGVTSPTDESAQIDPSGTDATDATSGTDLATSTTTIPPTTTTVPAVAFADTAWGTELADVGPDGTRSLESVLALFALAFGPLPGVDAPTDRTGITSGTIALRHVRAHWDELSPEQQAAVEAAIAPTDDAETVTVQPIGFRRVPASDLGDALAETIPDVRATYASRLGSDVPGTIDIQIGHETDDLGFADPHFTAGAYSGCTITISPTTSPIRS